MRANTKDFVPDKADDPSTEPLTDPHVNSPPTPPPSRQNPHPRRFATKCNHQLHPSASSHTPYCPTCVLHTLQAKLEGAQEMVLNAGGLDRSWELRDREWVNARVVYYISCRNLEKARKSDQLRWEREHFWDELHLRTEFEHIDKDRRPDERSGCSTCSSVFSAKFPTFGERVDNSLAWWDRSSVLASPPEGKTPVRSRFRRKKRTAMGSPSMRDMIHSLRTALLTATSEQQMWETRYKTERVIRRKHGLGSENQFEPSFWDSPISGLTVKDYFEQALAMRRMAERRARGNTPRPRPPRSSLSQCEFSEAIVMDEELKEAMRLREAADELEKVEREARRAGEEVGYLYFVGIVDGVERWRDDVLKSKPHLVWRDYTQSMDERHEDKML